MFHHLLTHWLEKHLDCVPFQRKHHVTWWLIKTFPPEACGLVAFKSTGLLEISYIGTMPLNCRLIILSMIIACFVVYSFYPNVLVNHVGFICWFFNIDFQCTVTFEVIPYLMWNMNKMMCMYDSNQQEDYSSWQISLLISALTPSIVLTKVEEIIG